MDSIRVVLAGQPNVGKSMLINTMTGSGSMRVGNFSGVTVEKTQICFEHHCHQFEIVDLPGTYSINGFSKEEKVREFCFSKEDESLCPHCDGLGQYENFPPFVKPIKITVCPKCNGYGSIERMNKIRNG